MPRIIHQSVTLPRQSTLHIARITLHSVMLEWRIGCNAECWTSVTLLAPCQVVLVSLLMNTNEHDAAVLGWKTPASNLLSPVTPLAPLPLPHWSLIKHAAGATCHVTCHEGCMMSTHWGRMGGKLTKHSSLFLLSESGLRFLWGHVTVDGDGDMPGPSPMCHDIYCPPSLLPWKCGLCWIQSPIRASIETRMIMVQTIMIHK